MADSGEEDGPSLFVRFPSPSGDPDRVAQVWVSDGDPSVEVGPCHTHFSPDDAGISEAIDLCRAILEDEVLIIEDAGGQYDGHATWIDLREPAALEEALTDPYSPGRAILKSWSGAADRKIGLDDL